MRLIRACAAAAALTAVAALAAEGDAKHGTQQSKFAACAHESKGLRGEEHQKFMSECLKGHDPERKAATHRAADDTTSQQNRMKSCNDDARARDLHGDERRAYKSTCLKGS
jgi:hypothetical protein